MKIIDTDFADLFYIDFFSFKDFRGEFVKTIHEETFANKSLDWQFKESFFSVSAKNVLRGMHFQYSPSDHSKLVYVIKGSILDVVLDLRHNSKTYGNFFEIELSCNKRNGLYIGKGFAHGFLSLEDNTIVEYHTSTSQSKIDEGGIRWNSFGFNWPVKTPITSERDMKFDPFLLENKYF